MKTTLLQKSLVSMLSIVVCRTATAGTTVENFSGSGTISLNYPGTVGLSGTTFIGTAILRSVEFTAVVPWRCSTAGRISRPAP